jgi:hypothetical protein
MSSTQRFWMPYGGTRIVAPATPLKLGCGPAVIQCRLDARWLQARKELSETPRPTFYSVAFPRHSVQMLPLTLCWLPACTSFLDSCSCSIKHPVAMGPICLSPSTTPRFCTSHAYWWKPPIASYRDDDAADLLLHRNVIDTISQIRTPRPRGLVC